MPIPRRYIGTTHLRDELGVLVYPQHILYQEWVDPAAKVTNGYSASHAGAAAAGTTSMTLGGSLAGTADVARNVVITVTHGSAVVAMSGTITGTDVHGKTQTEAWSVTAGGTTKTFTGKKGFKTVTSITETVAANASANTIIAGTGDVLGLRHLTEVPLVLSELVDGAIVTTGTVIAGSATTTEDRRGSYLPASVPNAARDYRIYYLVDDVYHVKNFD